MIHRNYKHRPVSSIEISWTGQTNLTTYHWFLKRMPIRSARKLHFKTPFWRCVPANCSSRSLISRCFQHKLLLKVVARPTCMKLNLSRYHSSLTCLNTHHLCLGMVMRRLIEFCPRPILTKTSPWEVPVKSKKVRVMLWGSIPRILICTLRRKKPILYTVSALGSKQHPSGPCQLFSPSTPTQHLINHKVPWQISESHNTWATLLKRKLWRMIWRRRWLSRHLWLLFRRLTVQAKFHLVSQRVSKRRPSSLTLTRWNRWGKC